MGEKIIQPTFYKGGFYNGRFYESGGFYNEGFEKEIEIGGRVYNVVKIGSQLWINENLQYEYGLSINPNSTPSTPAAWYYNKNKNQYGLDSIYKVGLLYNWYAVIEMSENNIFPNGWRIPDNDDIDKLQNKAGNLSTPLKAISAPSVNNWGGTDEYNFNALPTGLYEAGTFRSIDVDCNLWTTYETPANLGRAYGFDSTTKFWRYGADKTKGYAVRLCKDV